MKGSGWWYEGGGLYRHVHLVHANPIHIEQDGLYGARLRPKFALQDGDDRLNLTINPATTLMTSHTAEGSTTNWCNANHALCHRTDAVTQR
jgi:hypothetical protein